MSFGSGGYLAGVKFHPNLVSTYINRRVEEKRKELHEKADQYGKEYKGIIHGIHRNRKRLKKTSMVEYTEQMKTLQQNRWYVPSQSIVRTYDNRPALEPRQFPRDRQLPRIARSLDGGDVQLADRTSICSPKSIVSKSCSVPTIGTSRKKSDKRDGFRMTFDTDVADFNDVSGRVSPSLIKVIPTGWTSSETPETKKVNAFTGNYSGIMKVRETGSSKVKTVTIKLPVLNEDSHLTPDNGMTLTLEPELVVDKDHESNVTTVDESSEYDMPSTSVQTDDEDTKAKRREEHTRTLLRDAVEKLREMEDKYKNPTPLIIPKSKKKKRLKLSNSLDSIPEAMAESEKQEATGTRKKRYFISPNMVRTPRTPVIVKPSLDVIQELNTKQSVADDDIEKSQTNAFKGIKLNSRNIYSPEKNSRSVGDWDTSGGLAVKSQHQKHVAAAKVEVDYKSKRLHFGSKFGAKQKKLKFLKAY